MPSAQFSESVRRMLKAVAAICVKNSISFGEFAELGKQAFLEAATQLIAEAGGNVNTSRLSVMTGMHRRDVMRLTADTPEPVKDISVASRVLAIWENNPEFQLKNGKPRTLTCGGENNEFATLVAMVSRDVHPASILYKLELSGHIVRERETVKLVKAAHMVAQDLERGMAILSMDMNDLAAAVEGNLSGEQRVPNLHARTEFDNISIEDYNVLRQWILDEGSAFHRKVRQHLAQYDRDINPEISKGGGLKVVVGSFARFEEEGSVKVPAELKVKPRRKKDETAKRKKPPVR